MLFIFLQNKSLISFIQIRSSVPSSSVYLSTIKPFVNFGVSPSIKIRDGGRRHHKKHHDHVRQLPSRHHKSPVKTLPRIRRIKQVRVIFMEGHFNFWIIEFIDRYFTSIFQDQFKSTRYSRSHHNHGWQNYFSSFETFSSSKQLH